MNGVQLSQGYRATARRQFTLYFCDPRRPGIHFINLFLYPMSHSEEIFGHWFQLWILGNRQEQSSVGG